MGQEWKAGSGSEEYGRRSGCFDSQYCLLLYLSDRQQSHSSSSPRYLLQSRQLQKQQKDVPQSNCQRTGKCCLLSQPLLHRVLRVRHRVTDLIASSSRLLRNRKKTHTHTFRTCRKLVEAMHIQRRARDDTWEAMDRDGGRGSLLSQALPPDRRITLFVALAFLPRSDVHTFLCRATPRKNERIPFLSCTVRLPSHADDSRAEVRTAHDN